MNEESRFRSAFSKWKIITAVLVGLFISTLMVYRGLEQKNFIPVAKGTGEFKWKDVNRNGIVDTKKQEEFIAVPKGDYREETVSETLQLIEWSEKSIVWLLLALVFMVGRDFFYMLRIRILSRKQLNWKQCFDVIMLWEFASALSPGVVGGTTVAMFILKKEKIDLGRSTAIVMITALLDNLFYLLLIPLVFLFISREELFPPHFTFSVSVETVFWTGFLIKLLLCFFLFFSIFIRPKLAAKLLKSIFHFPLLRKWQTKAIDTGEELKIASKELKKEKLSFWLMAMMATFLSWVSRYMVINCLLNAFIKIDFLDNILLLGKQLVLWLLMMISPTPGGSGVAEFAFGELLANFSSSVLLIAALALLWRLISYFPYLFIGVIVLPRWIKK